MSVKIASLPLLGHIGEEIVRRCVPEVHVAAAVLAFAAGSQGLAVWGKGQRTYGIACAAPLG
jgi:hypothetical protein